MRPSLTIQHEGFDDQTAVAMGRFALATRAVPARRTLYREGEPAADFVQLLDGWAFRFKLLPDGRRQILSIILPGEPIALHTLWTDSLSFSVQSLTHLDLRLFDRPALVEQMHRDAALACRLGAAMAREFVQFENRLINLGQRTAVERVARLILHLHARLQQRDLVEDDVLPFPLRQQHIADVLGMTPVHVSRVFGELRAAQLIGRAGASLAILNYPRLVDIAGP
jgi:CRP-like cAMP-binding protein